MIKYNEKAWNFKGSSTSATHGGVRIVMSKKVDLGYMEYEEHLVEIANYNRFGLMFGSKDNGIVIASNLKSVLDSLANVYKWSISDDEKCIKMWFVDVNDVKNYVEWKLINHGVDGAYTRWIENCYVSEAFGPWVEEA